MAENIPLHGYVDSQGQITPYILRRSGPPCVELMVGMVTCHLYASKNRFDRQKRFEKIYCDSVVMGLPCKCLYDPLNREGMSRKERD